MKLPELPLENWEQTKNTLHLWLQIVGKVKLDLMPKRNHWWHITFLVSTKGLTSGPIPHTNGNFQFDFDFQLHRFEINTSWGLKESFDLYDGLSVAEFHKQFFQSLKSLKISANIIPVPYDHICEEPFEVCQSYHSYDKEYVHRFWQILVFCNNVFTEFTGRFYGKVSPVQLYWHHMDLAVTRFSGKMGPQPQPGASRADIEAYSHEVISAGFWAGDETVREAAFYSYTFPSPEGLDKKPLKPADAQWVDSNGSPMAMLMYSALQNSQDPAKDLMAFLESSYHAGARLADWPNELEVHMINRID